MDKSEKLLQLLDFSECRNSEDVQETAYKIASELMTNWKIQSFGQVRSFLGLEFYIYIPQIHEDSAVHRRCEQLKSGKFYFHTKSKSPKWSPPIFNRHGIDITCGSENKNIYGGILIRHVGGLSNKDGSGLALRVIMRGDRGFQIIKKEDKDFNWTLFELQSFRQFNGESIFNNEICLVHSPGHYTGVINKLKRVGIKKTSHADELLRFVR